MIAVIYCDRGLMSASLSVVIPAYNEAARLGNTLRAVVDYLRQNSPDGEVIVVDDGSSDETAELARQVFSDAGNLRTSVISYKSNLGKGRAVRLGLLAARGDVALFSDADLSTPITETPKLVEPIRERAVRRDVWFARVGPQADRRASTMASRTGRTRFQSGGSSGDGIAVLGHAVRLQGVSHERVPAADRSSHGRSVWI